MADCAGPTCARSQPRHRRDSTTGGDGTVRGGDPAPAHRTGDGGRESRLRETAQRVVPARARAHGAFWRRGLRQGVRRAAGRLGATGSVAHRNARDDRRVSLAGDQTRLRDVRGQRTGAEHDGRSPFCTAASRKHARRHGTSPWRRRLRHRPASGVLHRQVRGDQQGLQALRRCRWLSCGAILAAIDDDPRPHCLVGGGSCGVPRHDRPPRALNLGTRHVPGGPG